MICSPDSLAVLRGRRGRAGGMSRSGTSQYEWNGYPNEPGVVFEGGLRGWSSNMRCRAVPVFEHPGET